MKKINPEIVWKKFAKRYDKVDTPLIDTLRSWYENEYEDFEDFDNVEDAIDYIIDDIPNMYEASSQDDEAKNILKTFCPFYASFFDDE